MLFILIPGAENKNVTGRAFQGGKGHGNEKG